MTSNRSVCGFIFWLLAATVLTGSEQSDLRELQRKHIARPTWIQGYPCAAGYTWFFADGALRECAISRGIVFGAISIPPGSWINLTHAGLPDFVFLAHDTQLGPWVCKGGGLLGPTEGAMTTLYPGGSLRVCWLAVDTVVQGVPCMHASMWGDLFGGGSATEFHENGRLQACKLSRDFTFAGHSFRKGEHIHLTIGARLAAATR